MGRMDKKQAVFEQLTWTVSIKDHNNYIIIMTNNSD